VQLKAAFGSSKPFFFPLGVRWSAALSVNDLR